MDTLQIGRDLEAREPGKEIAKVERVKGAVLSEEAWGDDCRVGHSEDFGSSVPGVAGKVQVAVGISLSVVATEVSRVDVKPVGVVVCVGTGSELPWQFQSSLWRAFLIHGGVARDVQREMWGILGRVWHLGKRRILEAIGEVEVVVRIENGRVVDRHIRLDRQQREVVELGYGQK